MNQENTIRPKLKWTMRLEQTRCRDHVAGENHDAKGIRGPQTHEGKADWEPSGWRGGNQNILKIGGDYGSCSATWDYEAGRNHNYKAASRDTAALILRLRTKRAWPWYFLHSLFLQTIYAFRKVCAMGHVSLSQSLTICRLMCMMHIVHKSVQNR